MRIAGLAVLLASLLSTATSAGSPRITVQTHHGFEPLDQRFTVELPLNPDDTYVCWGYERSWQVRLRNGTLEDRWSRRTSCHSLHGTHDLKHHYPVFRDLPYGDYVGFLWVYDHDDSLEQPYAASTVGFRVLSQVDP